MFPSSVPPKPFDTQKGLGADVPGFLHQTPLQGVMNLWTYAVAIKHTPVMVNTGSVKTTSGHAFLDPNP